MTRIFFKLVCLLTAGLLASACQAIAERPGDDGNGEHPDDPKTLTTEHIKQQLENNGKRVFVVFSEFRAAGKVHACPVKIRTVDSVCASDDFQNNDPSVICRLAQGTSNNGSLTQIDWRSEVDSRAGAAVNFRVEFDANFEPCAQGWTGDKYASRHTCQLRDRSGLEIGGARRIYVKYTIVGDDPACPPLDPYFIVRH